MTDEHPTVEFTFPEPEPVDQHTSALQATYAEQQTLAATAHGIMRGRDRGSAAANTRGREHRRKLLDAKIRRAGVRNAAGLVKARA